MTAATTPAKDPMNRHVNDKCTVDSPKFPGVWTVIKVNPTTYRLEQNGRFLKAHKILTLDVTDADTAATPAAPKLTQVPVPGTVPFGGVTTDGNPPIGQPYQDVVIFDEGSVVRTSHPKAPGLWVVLADKTHATGKVNIAKLGGDAGRYLRMPPRFLTVVPLADILKDGAK